MTKQRPPILIVGALPPPAIGPFVAMQRLIASGVLDAHFRVSFLDISDHRPPLNIGQFDYGNLFLGLKHALQFSLRLITFRPEVVYVSIAQGLWGYLRDLAFIVPALLCRRRLVLHLRGSEFHVFYQEMPSWLRFITRQVMSRTDRMIVLGSGLRHIFDGFIDSRRIVVIPNGIQYRNFDGDTVSRTRKSASKLLFLSSLRKRKGLFVVLEAMPAVLLRFPDAELTIAGAWQSQEEETAAGEIIDRLQLQTHIRFVGEVTGNAKIRLFHEHDVFVFTPIEPEGLPWVILEAMSASMPVVTTNQGAIREVVEDGRTGFIVQPEPAHIAGCICRLLADPAEARNMGSLGRKRVEDHFSEETYFSRFIAVLKEAVEGTEPAALAGSRPAGSEEIRQTV